MLELGGKSPCIVDETANLAPAARRIVFGKFLNCGQTCVAPDYILCHHSVIGRLVSHIEEEIRLQYGENPLENPAYGKIVNEKHFARLTGLMDPEKTVFGGAVQPERCRIAPTVMTGVSWDDPVMGEEIFGPLLPVLPYRSLKDVVQLLADKPRPLALYFFSEDKARQSRLLRRCSFGGGCINDVIIHLATPYMGFGGVGESGMGAYHGKTGFDTFSHLKSIVDRKTWMELPMRFQPYTTLGSLMLRAVLR